MPWWNSPLDRLTARFAPTAAPAPAATRVGAPAAPPAEEWRDVPRVQRTLAEPIMPVAINDGFRDSLATFANPSFLAPLSHQVDPSAGGLAAGLVSPGRPQLQDGPDLAVPRRAEPRQTAQVQRRTTWSEGFADLPTVPLEFPHQTDSAASPVRADTAPDRPVPAHVGPGPGAGVPGAGAGVPGAGAGAPSAGAGIRVPAPESAAVGNPVVQRLPLAAEPVAPGPEQPSSEAVRPVVQRLGLAAAPVARGPEPASSEAADRPGETSPEPAELTKAVIGDPTGPAGETDPLASRLDEAPVTPGAVGPAITPDPVSPPATPDLPVAAPRSLSPRPTVPALAVQRAAAGLRPDTPTLGARTLTTSLSTSADPISPRIEVPSGPPVQRLSYISGDLHADRPHASAVQRAVAGEGSVPRGSGFELPVPLLRELPSLEQPPSPEVGSWSPEGGSWSPEGGSLPTGVIVAPVQRREVEPSEPPPAPRATTVPRTGEESGSDVTVSRHQAPEESATEVMAPGFTEVPLVVAKPSARLDAPESMSPEAAVDASAAFLPDDPSRRGQPTGPIDGPLGAAVPVEPWAPPAAPSLPPDSQRLGGTTRVASPIAHVQRRVAAPSSPDNPPEPIVRSPRAPSSLTPTAAQPPLVVARQVAAPRSPERGPRPGEGMSFASMFSAAGLGGADVDADPGTAPIGVQRQTEDSGATTTAAGSSVSTDVASEPAPAPAAAPPPAAGSAVNMDEMARRLYEPLAARLREELWLDRERAGLIGDA